LDVHPEVNCGDETKIVHLLLKFIESVLSYTEYTWFMQKVGVKRDDIDKATGLFIYYLMEQNGKNYSLPIDEKVLYLCNKEPVNTGYMIQLKKIFPNSRFIYLVRDGRDVSLSFMRRNKDKLESRTFFKYLKYWNQVNLNGTRACRRIGNACKMVKYEALVTKPEETLREVVGFLNLTWTNDMLTHEKYLGHGISLSELPIFGEMQKKQINNASIGQWKSNKLWHVYNESLVNEKIPMLRELNY
jgi:protein-tyrosine sulfotransferase